MRGSTRPRLIDLECALVEPGIEVVEFRARSPTPSRLFAALDDLPEPAYRPPSHDPTGSAGLWRALQSL